MVYKIMIVEDDATIAATLQKHLIMWGYEVYGVVQFQDVLSEFVRYTPHLVLMDISLPFFNGYHWCREIRKISTTPIMFLSSANEPMNIVMAMNMGADDFIAKPFEMEVLVAKVSALLRRAYHFPEPSSTLRYKGIEVNLSEMIVVYEGQKIALSKNDTKILQTLLERKGQVVSRDLLMLKLWETDQFVDENTLTVNITRLRKKLEAIGLVDFIVTKKGAGYFVEGQ